MKKVLSLLVILLLITGCGGGNNADVPSDTTETSNSDVTIQVPADIMSMNPFLATDGQSFTAQNMCFAGLTQLDVNGNPVPDLAASWDISDDGCVYTFHLVDTSWSNGDKLTANDFVDGWRISSDVNYNTDYYWLFQTANVLNSDWSEAGGSADTMGVKAIDEKTLEVTLTQPTGFFLQITSFPTTFPVNKKFFDSCGDQYALSLDNLVFCGPYKMTSWDQGYGYTFELNENYFDYENYKKYSNKVNFRIVSDTQSALMDYEAGNLDYVLLSGAQVKANSSMEGFTERLGSYNFYLILNINYLASNGNAAIANLNCRKAMSYGIDRQDICDSINDGSIAAGGIVPYKLCSNPETGKDFREDAGNILEFDQDKAKEFYAEACKELGVDNISIDLMYSTDQGDPEIVAATRIAAQLEEVGFTVTLNGQPKKSRLNVYQHVNPDNTANFEVSLTRWGPDYGDPQTYMDLFISSNTANNNGGYMSETYDQFISIAEAAGTSPIDRWNAFIDAEKTLVAEDYGIVPVFQNGGACLINPKITGIEFHSASVDVFRHIVSSK